MTDENKQTETIRKQNDAFRQLPNFAQFFGIQGKIVITQGIAALPEEDKAEIFKAVTAFNEFSEENDPYGTHEFGAFDCKENKIFWKIDCYDTEYNYGSEDLSDLTKTARVLTILLASEY